MNKYRYSGRTGRKGEARRLNKRSQIHGALLQNE